MWIDGVEHGDAGALRDAAGHERGLREAARAVVHAGVGDLHAEELGGEGLELERALQSSLRHLGLIGGVGGEEFPARHEGRDDGGTEVVVDARAEEAGMLARMEIALRQRRHLGAQLHLRHRGREREAGVAELLRDVAEQGFDGRGTDLREHGSAVVVGVGDEG